jgi:hypothetical protein
MFPKHKAVDPVTFATHDAHHVCESMQNRCIDVSWTNNISGLLHYWDRLHFRPHLYTAMSKKMAHLISAQLIARSEAWLAHRSIYLPSMSYSLPSSSFTRRELATVQRRPVRALLSAMGFNRNMPLQVVFGPTSIGGLGLRHLYV